MDCKPLQSTERGASGIENSGVGGSSPPLGTSPAAWETSHAPRKWGAGWRDPLVCERGVYLRRWYVETPWGSVRLHHWLHGDDHRAWHSHPWPFWTLILRGQYTDLSPAGEVVLRTGQGAARPAAYTHTVRLDAGPCWSLVVTGPIVRRWGFWDGRKWWRSNKWFAEIGRHPCQ